MADFKWDDYSTDDSAPTFDFEAHEPVEEEHRVGEGWARGALNALPAAGAMFGGAAGALIGAPTGPGAIATGIAGGALGAAGGEALKNIGEHFLGDQQTREEIYSGPVRAGIEGATWEMGGQAVGAVPGLIKKGLSGLSKPTAKMAEDLAVNATGATGAQSAKFSDDAGRELLDRKLVQFGDSAANVAKRTGAAMDDANLAIDSALKQLDAKGVTASADNVVSELQQTIAGMRKDPSKAGTVRKLQSIIDDIIETGESNIPLSMGEETKRGFRKAAGNWMDPEAGQAGKQAYLGYRNEVENAAQAADPALANMFKEGKETHGLLAPIQEAAERRASTVKQSPFGGLLDVAAAGVGGAPGVIGRRLISPRISSSAAVTADKISKYLAQSPQMAELAKNNPSAFKSMVQMLESKAVNLEHGAPMSLPRAAEDQGATTKPVYDKGALLERAQGSKYAQVLQNAADKSDQSLAAAHFVLAQRDPEYRKLVE